MFVFLLLLSFCCFVFVVLYIHLKNFSMAYFWCSFFTFIRSVFNLVPFCDVLYGARVV